jgi:hypothetical protein
MLWLTGTTLNIQSFMGAIMAIGVAVANAILLVTFAERSRIEGHEPWEAAIEGARSRLRPILMTSFAMLAGMAPMALGLGEGGEQSAPLGRAVIGGLLGATCATLIILPAILATLQSRHKRPHARRVASQRRHRQGGSRCCGSEPRSLAANQVDVAAATVEKIKTLLAYTQIVAPFDGVVARRQVNRGDLVQGATATRTMPSAGSLFTVQRIDMIRVFCDVPENDVPHLNVGDPAIVKPSGFDGRQFIGKVTRFSLRLDPETRNMRTEIDLPNSDERLYPGMYAEVSLEMNQHSNALTIPAAAVGSDVVGNFVYTVTDDRITRLAVGTGLTDDGRTEVTGGLSEGTQAVASLKGVPSLGTVVRPIARENP